MAQSIKSSAVFLVTDIFRDSNNNEYEVVRSVFADRQEAEQDAQSGEHAPAELGKKFLKSEVFLKVIQ